MAKAGTINILKPSTNFLTDRSKAMLLLWIFFVFCVCLCHTVLSVFTALWKPSGKGLTSWPSCLWCFLVWMSLSIRCPGSGVVLDRIDSWSLPSFLFELGKLHSVQFSQKFCFLTIGFRGDIKNLSLGMRYPTMWQVRQAKVQTSQRVRTVWSEPLLVAWIFYEY